jgi:outer membrane protein assembly factor BamB
VLCLDATTGAVKWTQKVEALITAAGATVAAMDSGFIVSRSR